MQHAQQSSHTAIWADNPSLWMRVALMGALGACSCTLENTPKAKQCTVCRQKLPTPTSSNKRAASPPEPPESSAAAQAGGSGGGASTGKKKKSKLKLRK
jgi:hypothetical protein